MMTDYMTERKAEELANRLTGFSSLPTYSRVRREEDPKQIVMYSYDRAGRQFYTALIYELLEEGLTEEQVIDFLQSKLLRHMFDHTSDEFTKAAKAFICPQLIKDIKEL